MFRLTLLLALATVVACGGKEKKPETAPAGEAALEMPKDVPDDDASKAFARKLMKHKARDFRPTEASGAQLVYKTMTFNPDHTWVATALMTADGETFDCNERGTWKMDAADDRDTAHMDWKLEKSTCAGRPQEGNMRVHVRISDEGDYKVVMR